MASPLCLSAIQTPAVVDSWLISAHGLDILPRLKHVGFWGQAGIANEVGLTSPNPCVDAPTR